MTSRARGVSGRCALLLGIAAIGSVVAPQRACGADYTFVIEPSYRPERALEIYQPLATYLSKATGEHFTLVTPKNYHFYWRDLRAGAKADFAFDEAHLTDYRIKHNKYEPLVRTAEKQSYTLVTNIDIGKAGPRGLVGHTIVAMPAPSLGYGVLLEFYPNPVQQPETKSTAGSWTEAVDSVFNGEADAAIIPTALKNQYPNLTAVKTSREFAGQCISAAPDVPEPVKQKVKDALVKLDTDPGSSKLLLDLGVSRFVPANAQEYAGAEQILKEFFGYK